MIKAFISARWLLVGLLGLGLWVAPTAALADYESGYTAFQKGDYATALNDWKLAAESGDARAQFYLGAMYDFALGVKEDDAVAADWYRKAAEQGHADAQFNLGSLYAVGSGVPVHKVESQMWFERAAAQGHVDAQRSLSPRGSDRATYGQSRELVDAYNRTVTLYGQARLKTIVGTLL